MGSLTQTILIMNESWTCSVTVLLERAKACADMLARLGHYMLGNEDWVNVHPLPQFGICCILILLVEFSLA